MAEPMLRSNIILIMACVLNLLGSVAGSAVNAQSGIVINELQASNLLTAVDEDYHAFSDWVELTNTGNAAVDLSGFFVTDDLADPQKWEIPQNTVLEPGDYLLIWCDDQDTSMLELHASFRLSAGGEEFGIYDPSLNLVDSVVFPEQWTDISYGRYPNGTTGWYYFPEPTPAMPNTTTAYSSGTRAPDVVISLAGGFYSSPVSVAVSSDGADEVRYTLDGSIPDLGSPLYQESFSLDSTVVLQARAFVEGLLPGPVASATYFVGEQTELPVAAMTLPPEYLTDPEVGIYVDEDINQRRDWERAAHIDYYDSEHQLAFSVETNIRLFGNSAIYYPQKSLAVFPDQAIEYPLFPSRQGTEYQSFLLRSSSDDWPYTMMRDALMQSLVQDRVSLDVQAYEPAVLFINGRYFGIHNIREKLNEDYLETYHNVDRDDLDMIFIDMRDTTIDVLNGSVTDLEVMLDFIEGHDLSDDANYETLQQMMDVVNYADYLVGNLFFTNTSWHHNVKIWKDRAGDDRWQWLFYDLDRGMGLYYLNLYNVVRDLDTTDLFFPHLSESVQFRNLLLNRMSLAMNTFLGKDRVIHVIDSLKDRIAGEIPQHSLRWKDECDAFGHCGIQSYGHWLADVEGLVAYTEAAYDKVRNDLGEYYGLPGTAELTILNENPALGKVYVNGVECTGEGMPWTWFRGVPLDIEAVAGEGNVFLGWTGYSFNPALSLELQEDLVLHARFGSLCELPAVVDEDLTIGACDAYITQGHLEVMEGATLTIEPGTHVFITPGDTIFVYGSLYAGGSPDGPVVFRSVDDNNYWGLIYAPEASLFIDHTEFVNCKAAVRIDGGELEISNSTVHYSPYFYSDIISVHHAHTTIKDNVIFGPDDEGKSDAIDCDEVPYALIMGNAVYGTTDDGIDVGTASQQVVVKGNRLFDCKSMGITIGEYTEATVNYNIIGGCGEAGIQVHTGATAFIDHNTLFGNQVAVRAFHYDEEPQSGGNAHVTNSILSASTGPVYEEAANSVITFDYSISDTDPIAGGNNLLGDPLMKDPFNHDFSLLESSPCIDSGDPDFPPDPDGSPTDRGALFYDHVNSILEKNGGNELVVFPNPAQSHITCILTDTSSLIREAWIINQQGQLVSAPCDIQGNRVRVNTSVLSQGTYHLLVQTSGNNRVMARFIILNPGSD